ncbi:MAG: cytosine permease, partial [Byssovorax sp.]
MGALGSKQEEEAPDAPAAPRAAPAFQVERHGLLPIPLDERRGHPRQLFWVWLGGAYNYVTLAAGALPILFGLSLRVALVAVVIGNVLGAIVFGLAARPGPRTATATIVNTRAAFGHRGNLAVAAVSFFSVFGWVAVNSVLAAFALFQLFTAAGAPPSPAGKALLVALVLLAQMVIAIYGHAAVMALEPVFGIVSAVLITGLLIFIAPKIDWHAGGVGELAASTQAGTFFLALGAMFAGPLSWTNYAADYSRYLPEDADVTHVALYSGLGMGVAGVVGSSIGALLATLVDMHDPLSNVPRLLPTWYLLLFLAAVIWGAVANNVMNLYTAGLGLLALR